MAIHKRLLRAILNCGIDVWKIFSYDEKKNAILEVTPYNYNIKYGLFFMSKQNIKYITKENKKILSFDYKIDGEYTDFGIVFLIENVLYTIENNKFVPIIAQPFLLELLKEKKINKKEQPVRSLIKGISPITILSEGLQDNIKNYKVILNWNELHKLKDNCDDYIDTLDIIPIMALKFNKCMPNLKFDLIVED